MNDQPKTLVELFEVPGTWTQNSGARDDLGNVVEPESGLACKFCLVGALELIYGSTARTFNLYYGKVKTRILQDCGVACVAEWNDMPGRSQKEVLELCKELKI